MQTPRNTPPAEAEIPARRQCAPKPDQPRTSDNIHLPKRAPKRRRQTRLRNAAQARQLEQQASPLDEPARKALDIRTAGPASLVLLLLAAASTSRWLHPLVYAHADGYTVLGFARPEQQTRAEAVKAAQQLTAEVTRSTAITTLVGEYAEGARLCVTPMALPHDALLCHAAALASARGNLPVVLARRARWNA